LSIRRLQVNSSKLQNLLCTGVLAILVIASSFASASGTQDTIAQPVIPDPRIVAMLGSACPPERALLLARVLVPAEGDTRSLADQFSRQRSASGGDRYEASKLTVDVALPGRQPLHVHQAYLALEPSGDGSSVHFEIEGPVFGAASRVSAAGSIEWRKGPLGGDKLTLDWAIDDADLQVLRVAFPERFDPAFIGPLDLSGHGEGIVGEETTEDAPATPLKGKMNGSVDWQVLGRRDALVFSSAFSLDDRSVRLSGARLESFGLGMDVSGWFDPAASGQFRLNGSFAGVDAAKVANDWQVPASWRPVATLSGKMEFWGKPATSFLAYDVKADDISVPALGGYSIRTGPVRLEGRLLAVNADVSGSVRPTMLQVGPMRLDNLPFGISWWRDALSVTAANTELWGGPVTATVSYKPATDPAFQVGGVLKGLRARDFTSKVLPSWGLDVDGTIDVAYRIGQDSSRVPFFSARAYVARARLGTSNLVEQALAALASMPTPLPVADAGAGMRKLPGGATLLDSLFLELEKRGDALAIGGLLARGGALAIDGSGTMAGSPDLDVAATLRFPPEVAETIVTRAKWAAPLRAVEGDLYVPLHIGGKPGDPRVTLAPEFVHAVAEARAGRPVTAFAKAIVEHVAISDLGALAKDPSAPLE